MIFYKRYTYAPRATFISVFFSLLALMLVIIGVMLAVQEFKDGRIATCVVGVLIAAAAIPTFIFGSRKLADKVAKKDGVKNIYSKAKYAKLFLQSHPEAYDEIVRKNADFAAKYVRNEAGKIVKRAKA